MSTSKAIQNLSLFNISAGNVDDLYRIFNIPFPGTIEIDDAIRDFIKALNSNYDFDDLLYGESEDLINSWLDSEESPNENNMLQRKYGSFMYFSFDVFGNLATSIKLAGEGYIYQSLAILRSAIDILFSSLFGSESEIPRVIDMTSPYYHQLNEISWDDIVINNIQFGEGVEDEDVILRKAINNATSNCLDNYLKELRKDGESITVKDLNRYKKIIRDSLIRASAEMMNKSNDESYKSIKNEITHPSNFFGNIVMDDRYTYRACEEHERNLLERLQKQLEIGGNFDILSEEIKDGLRQLTFDLEIPWENEDRPPTCDDCDNPPVIWSIHVRFDKKSMLKYLKAHLDKDALIKINECTKLAFNGKHNEFFGDVIDRKIYNKLNPYSHGDPKDEPSIQEWYIEYMKPFLESLSCIYSNLIQNQETSKRENS